MTNTSHQRRCRVYRAVLHAGLLLGTLFSPAAVHADDLLSPKLDDAVGQGLIYLSKQQNAEGSIDGGGPKIAMTSLAMMAFLASGHTPDVGKHGLLVGKCIDYLVQQSPEDGYYGKVDGSRMYGQGITTLAMAECLGVEPAGVRRDKLRAALTKAVKVILTAQDVKKDAANAGGWRYEPSNLDSDLSLSGWNALALRAAQNVGIAVPKDRAHRAVEFVLKCYRADQKGFAYTPGNECSAGMTGVGILNLYLLDAADRPEAIAAAPFLVQHPVTDQTRFQYYYLYYTTQAAYQSGEPIWSQIWKINSQQLLSAQMPDGGWPASRSAEEPGRVFATSMAVLTLSVPYRLLPTYQR